MKTETVTTMDYREFETLVQKTYGVPKDWSVVASEEWGNDESHSFECAAYLDDDEVGEDVAAFIQNPNNTKWIAASLLQDMVKKSVLVPGKYVIEVSW